MFVVLLKFSAQKDRAGDFMDKHKAWLKRGFEDGVFLLAGGLPPGAGGGILVHNIDRGALEARLADDPFVAEDVVRPEIIEIAPAMTDKRLDFLTA
ncbi:hypothetical protein [Nisaea sp.]|uniref:YciI family protein n=1 Tax=Nisaea sp. TaxID=2024842 RepID=UPI003262EF8D